MADFDPSSFDISEDDLRRENEDPLSDIADTTPEFLDDAPIGLDGEPLRKRGRPKRPYNRRPGSNPPGLPPGSPKQPGSGRPPRYPKVTDAEIVEKLNAVTPKLVERLCEIALGKEVWQLKRT